MTYQEWIAEYTSNTKFLVGRCLHATLEMCKVFPELKRVPGHVLLPARYEEHWWCETPDGKIVDPTADQWETAPIEYVPWKPGTEVVVGKCMDCGATIYGTPDSLDGNRQEFCDDRCRDSYLKYLMSGVI